MVAKGQSMSEEHKQKISAANKGKPKSDAHRASMSRQRTGRPMPVYDMRNCIECGMSFRPGSASALLCFRHTQTAKFEQLRMIRDQVGRCEICEETKDLSVDHDHATGLIRGVLCTNCNLGLGSFKDSQYAMKKAIEYLTRTPLIEMMHPTLIKRKDQTAWGTRANTLKTKNKEQTTRKGLPDGTHNTLV